MARFAKTDWLALGLAAVAEGGPPALTIDALTRRAGKTRGSFYAHFADMAGFLAALADHWRERYTTRLIETANAQRGAARRLDCLNELAFRLNPRVEQGMRRLANVNDAVAAVAAAVDQTRMAYLAKLYRDTGRYSPEEAEALATIEYAAFVGLQQITTRGAGDVNHLYEAFLTLTRR